MNFYATYSVSWKSLESICSVFLKIVKTPLMTSTSNGHKYPLQLTDRLTLFRCIGIVNPHTTSRNQQ